MKKDSESEVEGSNQTILGLKFLLIFQLFGVLVLLKSDYFRIEMKMKDREVFVLFYCSNQTILGLKYSHNETRHQSSTGSNQTILGLKLWLA